MKLIRLFGGVAALVLVAGLALVAQQASAPGATMVAAAQKFLGSLSGEQKAQTTFAFDDAERTNWNFIPLQDNTTRKSTRKRAPARRRTA